MSPESLQEVGLPGVSGLGALSEAPGSIHVFGMDRNLRVMWMSEQLRILLGRSGVRSPVGHALREVVPGIRPEHVTLLGNALETGSTVAVEDLPFETPDQKTTFWDVQVVPIPAVEAVGGPPVFSRLVVILTDVTHRVEQRAELRVIADETEAQRQYLAALEQKQRREKELAEAANAVSRAIANSLDVESVLRRGAEEAGHVLGAETTLVTVRDEHGWLVKYAVGSRHRLEGRRFAEKDLPLHGEAAEDGEVKAICDAGWLSGLKARSARRIEARALLIAPLFLGPDTFGSLTFSYHSRRHDFTPAEVVFAGTVAASISMALQNASLYEREHSVAHELQKGLISIDTRPAGLRFGRLYRSSTEASRVGGDFYDLFQVGRRRTALVVGDVCGHGLAAARLAFITRDLVRAYAYTRRRPDVVLNLVNRALLRHEKMRDFVTLLVGFLDTRHGSFTYSIAGHPPPLLLPKDGQPRLLPRAGFIPLGVLGRPSYEVLAAPVSPGDRLILYTDGLTEARRGTGKRTEVFGEERLIRLAEAHREMPINRLPLLILREVEAFCEGTLKDDLAIIAVEVE